MLAPNACGKYIQTVTDKIIKAWAAKMARLKAAKMTPAERSEHARKMALARWAKAKARG